MTQLELIQLPARGTMLYELLLALKNGERLTPLSALEKYHCFSLSQRMGELKRSGWPIRSQMVTVSSGKKVASYWLQEMQYA